MKKASNAKKLSDLQIDEEYKSIIIEKGYLGKKGYTIPKSCLSKEDYDFLKKDLLLKTMFSFSERLFSLKSFCSNKIHALLFLSS